MTPWRTEHNQRGQDALQSKSLKDIKDFLADTKER